MKIVPFHQDYATAFYELNIDWLETYFYVEPYDREVLSKPEQYIIATGGHIFSAVIGNKVLGTVALLKRGDGIFELTKMAVLPESRGQKIGQKLMEHCLQFAKANHFKELYLYSNTILENAIYIYKKVGFKEVPIPKDNPYKRTNIKMVYTHLS